MANVIVSSFGMRFEIMQDQRNVRPRYADLKLAVSRLAYDNHECRPLEDGASRIDAVVEHLSGFCHPGGQEVGTHNIFARNPEFRSEG